MLTMTFPNISVSSVKSQLVAMLLFYTLIVSPIGWAQITLDGTLGRSGALSGPDFAIKAEYGQQHGGHLFHSFGQFNLDLGQSATFSGPNSVNNIISRVTGGNPSRINGLLRSTIPNANVYFLNPYGILFGEGAGLDVQGSFHASTADTLRFSDGREFNARTPEQPLLTVAPISAFGFLTDTPAAISLQDSQLSVSEGQTLSLIGGDLRISGSALPIYDAENDDLVFSSTISAESGRLNFASLASRGEIVTNESGLNLSAGMQGGQIAVNNTRITTTGESGGRIFIRGGRFELINSDILHETFGNQNGGIINILADSLEQHASIIDIDGGKEGSIFLKISEALTLSGNPILSGGQPQPGFGSKISSQQKPSGEYKGGRIEIEARQMTLKDGAQIGSGAFGTGEGGSTILKVTDTLTLQSSGIFANTESQEPNAGKAGNIEIEARQIILDGAQIGSGTLGTGEGGSIHIKADRLIASGISDAGFNAGIFVSSHSTDSKAGNAGMIEIETQQMSISDRAVISSTTFGSGMGGTIIIKVTDALTIQSRGRIVSHSESKEAHAGKGGQIEIEARQITLLDGAQIDSGTSGTGESGSTILKVTDTLTLQSGSGIFATTESEEPNAGNAGNIEIEARQITLLDGAKIASGTFGTGEGGTIIIKVADTLTLSGVYEENFPSGIRADSTNDSKPNAGKAGNIEIEAQQISISDGALISSTTFGSGTGGTIVIKVADALTIQSSGIFSNSESQQNHAGKAGNIEIEGRQITLTDGGQIGGGSLGPGEGGTIIIQGVDVLTISGISENNITSGVFGSSESPEVNAGEAGDITAQANTIKLTEEGTITTFANNADGGNITVNTPNLLYLRDSEISTDVTGGLGNGGNINIDQPQFTVLDNGIIIADAHGGNGGNIHIIADQFLRTPDSRVTASSRLGIDGNVQIDAPETHIGEEMVVLPKQFANLPLPDWCDTQLSEDKESSRFVVNLNQVGKPRDELRGGVLGSYLDITTQH